MSVTKPKTLADLKPGDEVAIENQFRPPYIRKIDRITPTGRIVVVGRTYRPDGQVSGGDKWNRDWIVAATADHHDQIKRAKAFARCDSLWAKHAKSLSTACLLAMADLIEADKASKESEVTQ